MKSLPPSGAGKAIQPIPEVQIYLESGLDGFGKKILDFELNLNFVWYTDGQIHTKEPNE